MADDIVKTVLQARPTSAYTRLSWGSIVAGAFAGVATFLTLSMLGAAVNISPEETLLRGGMSAGRGIWAEAVILVSLFVGGAVTSRSASYVDRVNAVLHGVVLWSLTFTSLLVLGIFGVKAGITALISSALTPGGIVRMPSGWWALGGLVGSLLTAIMGTVAGCARFMPLERGRLESAGEARAA